MSKIDEIVANASTAEELVAALMGVTQGVTDYEVRLTLAYTLYTLDEYKTALSHIAKSNGCAAVKARAALENSESRSFAQTVEGRVPR